MTQFVSCFVPARNRMGSEIEVARNPLTITKQGTGYERQQNLLRQSLAG